MPECDFCGSRFGTLLWNGKHCCLDCFQKFQDEKEKRELELELLRQNVTKEGQDEKHVIIKIRCPYCKNVYDETLDKCPHCGAHI